MRGASSLAVQDSLLMGTGASTAVANLDSLSTLTVGGSTRMGVAGNAGLFVFKGSHATLPGLTMGPVYSILEVGYGGAQVDVANRFDVTGPSIALVDTGGVLTYSGGSRALSIGDGLAHVYVNRSGLLQASPQIDVRGSLTLSTFIGDLVTAATTTRVASAPGARPAVVLSPVPGASGRIQAPLTRLLGNGALDGIGTLAGRLRIEAGTATFTVGANGSPYTGRTVVGDSTKSDGFYSVGQTTLLDGDTLTTLDSDGPDLGKVRIEGGVLQTSKPGHLRAGFRLDGHGAVLGSLDVRDSAWVSFAGSVSGDLALAGTLDLNTTVAYLASAPNATALTRSLALGSFHPAATGRTTLRIGAVTQDQIAVASAVVLGGTLDVRTVSGDAPGVGALFTVLTAPSVTGTFASVTLNGRPPGGAISVLYGSNNVRVVVLTPITTGVDDGGVTTPAAPVALRFAAAGAPRDAALALDLPAAARVHVALYDVSGRRLAVLADAELGAGRHRWALVPVAGASGVVFARAEITGAGVTRVLTARAIVLR